jgi:nitrogen fixation NifU-like protein
MGEDVSIFSSIWRVNKTGTGVYSERIKNHYANPRNSGRIANPSAEAIVRSTVDSDTVLITMRIENGVVADVRFKCMGCAVAIACSSVATEMVLGKPVEEAEKINKQDVADALGGIPEYKMVCSNLAPDAIRKALQGWRKKQTETI